MPLTGLSPDQKRRELWASYRRTGKIGRIRPKSKAQARKIIEAIVHSK